MRSPASTTGCKPYGLDVRPNGATNPLLHLDWLHCPSGTSNDACDSNNGNVTIQNIQAGTSTSLVATFSQTYAYDKVNRITQVTETASGSASGTWAMAFGYDGFGNRAVAGPSLDQTTPTATSQYNVLTNRMVKDSANNTMPADAYDSAGNLTRHPFMSGLMAYDAEGRLSSMGGTSFVYDGQGQRVQKMSTSGTTTYVYDAQGGLAAEYGSAAGSSCTTCYLTADPLGSTRLVTDGSGAVKQRRDFHPFGEEILANATFGNRQVVTDGGTQTTYGGSSDPSVKFTGQLRDVETGLDFFGARYMSSPQGRFTSPDPLSVTSARLTDPQQFNLYAYVRNNPFRLIDPTGLDPVPVACQGPTSGNCYSSSIVQGEQEYAQRISKAPTIRAVERRRTRGPLDKPIGAAKELVSDAVEIMSLGDPTEAARGLMRWLSPSTDDEQTGANAVDLAAMAMLPFDVLGLSELITAHSFVKHVLVHGEFPGWIRTTKQMEQLVGTF